MLIGIDGNEANTKMREGVHQYAFEILWGLYRLNKDNKTHKFTIYLKEPPTKDLPQEDESWCYHILPGGKIWILSKLTPYLLFTKKKPDVFFSPSHYFPPLTLMPSVCTIHDLGYLKFSEQFRKYDFWQLKLWTAISISISKYIIAVSKHTKTDIVRHYPSASKKTVVIYHGYDKSRFKPEISEDVVRRVKKKYKIDGKYILFLSTLKPSKNIEGLIDAFSLLSKNGDIDGELRLVISGRKGWLYESIYEKARDLSLGKKVIFTDFVSENDKPALIKGALVFASPSFWEGFGIHVLESLACGTPVVVSKIASLPEVAGIAGKYVEPKNISSISNGIKQILSLSKVEYNKLVEKGYAQAQKFSWNKSAQETLRLLEKVN